MRDDFDEDYKFYELNEGEEGSLEDEDQGDGFEYEFDPDNAESSEDEFDNPYYNGG